MSSFPADWESTKLGKVTKEMFGGGTPSTKNPGFWQGNIPWLTSKSLGDSIYLTAGEKTISEEAVRKSATHIVPAGNLIFATRVGVGKVVVTKIDVAISQDSTGIVVDPTEVAPTFLAYQLRTNSVQRFVEQNKRGATIQGITRTSLQQVDVVIPPLPEQQRIAHVLNTVQTAIEQQARLIALTRELKRALMKKLFTEGLRGEKQKDTEIGPVPESWEVASLSRLAERISKGSSPRWQGFEYVQDGVLFVRSQNVGWGRLDFSDRVFLSQDFNKKERRSILKSSDILVNLVGASIGRVALGRAEIEGANCNQAVCFVRLNAEDALRELIVWYLLSPTGQRQMFLNLKDIARANLSLADVGAFKVPLPKGDEVVEIASIFSTIEDKIEGHERKKTRLEELFRTLLHQLMTAQIRVNGPGFELLDRLAD